MIDENEKIKLWLSRFGRETKRQYRKWALRFFKDTQLKPEELLEMCRDEPSKAKAIIFDYINNMKQKGRYIPSKKVYIPPKKQEVSTSVKKNVFTALKSFIDFYREEYNIKIELSLKGVLRVKKEHYDYIPSTNEVLMLLDRAQVNLKPCIALIAFAGMRPSDVVNLKFQNVMDEIEWDEDEQKYVAKKIPLKIILKQKKTGEFYVTFLGAKGVRIFCSYLTYLRKKLGRPLKPEDKLFVYSSTESLLTQIFRVIDSTVGKNPEAFKRFRPYSLRKYFRREISVLGEEVAEYLMGHVKGIEGLVATYSGLRDLDRRAIEQLREQYAKVMHRLEGEVPIDYVGEEVANLKKRFEIMERFIRAILPELQPQVFKLISEAEKNDMSIEELMNRITELIKEKSGEKSKKNHYIIVDSEKEMLKKLNEGWDLVKELNNHKYLLKAK